MWSRLGSRFVVKVRVKVDFVGSRLGSRFVVKVRVKVRVKV